MGCTYKTLAAVLGIAGTLSVGAGIASAQTDVYSVNYFSNNVPAAPDATLRIVDPGLTYGNLCSMVYVFADDQQLTECCGCVNTPDGARVLSVKTDLTSNPLTGVVPTDGVIKIISARAAAVGTMCNPATNVVPVPNLRNWATHIGNPTGKVYPITETASSKTVLGATELANLQAQCAFAAILGSGHGLCTCGYITPPCVTDLISFTVTPTSVSLAAGKTQQLTATAKFNDGTVPVIAWSSSNPSIATVSSTGLVTGVSAGGPVTITASLATSCGPATVSITVTVSTGPPPPPPTACTTASSLGLLIQGSAVTAYVPNGSWSTLSPGLQVVPIEPTPVAAPATVITPGVVNSCAANPDTGEAVCTANDTNVYLLTGSHLNATLTSGATGSALFSGGLCENCALVINPVTDTAAISIGISGIPSQSGLQFLDLNTNTFSARIPSVNELSEEIVWDPNRNLILSPDEQGTYDLFDTSTTTPVEYANSFSGAPNFDSAAEDCTTGIALATDEYTSNLFIADLTQAKFKSGSPAGTWTAPSSELTIPDFNPYDGPESGTTGIAVAAGTHLGIVTGEYPNPPNEANAIIAIQLPATSGTGTPAFVDWAVAVLPNDPVGSPFDMGCDPHTVTAYVSPSTGKAMGIVTDYAYNSCRAGGTPQYLGLIDLQGLLSAPRTAGTHTVNPTYNLLTSGIVKFVKTN